MHLDLLNNLLTKRNHAVQSEVPKIGYVAMHNDDMIAVAFLRMVEGGFAQLDGLASNPDYSGTIRHEAQDLVIDKCLKHAKSLGINHIYAFTSNIAPLTRSFRHGFVELPHLVVAIDLNKV
jgi:N-acetylglutamate synthase-like GNAT family acetyltransferase